LNEADKDDNDRQNRENSKDCKNVTLANRNNSLIKLSIDYRDNNRLMLL